MWLNWIRLNYDYDNSNTMVVVCNVHALHFPTRRFDDIFIERMKGTCVDFSCETLNIEYVRITNDSTPIFLCDFFYCNPVNRKVCTQYMEYLDTNFIFFVFRKTTTVPAIVIAQRYLQIAKKTWKQTFRHSHAQLLSEKLGSNNNNWFGYEFYTIFL